MIFWLFLNFIQKRNLKASNILHFLKNRNSKELIGVKFVVFSINSNMKDSEIKALVSLLEDEDALIQEQVYNKIRSLGTIVLPYLESHWSETALSDPFLHKKIEDLIHDMQYSQVKEALLLWKEGGCLDLLEGFLAVINYMYPEHTIEQLRTKMEQLFYEFWIEFSPDMHPSDQIKVLNSVFFDKLKFSPNTKNFHSLSNSMLHLVIDNKKGNPISLCCIYMLVAQKLGLPIYGVNLPNLFVLTYKTEQTQFYINVFNKGLVFYKSDIDNYIMQLNLKPADVFYNVCSHADIIKRVLRNVGLSFEKTGEKHKLHEIEALLKIMEG
jgi:regulator of sirC expression with transglutaminase-like and TPR domain